MKLIENILFGIALGLLGVMFVGFFVMFACILFRNDTVLDIAGIISGIAFVILIGPGVMISGLFEILSGESGGKPW